MVSALRGAIAYSFIALLGSSLVACTSEVPGSSNGACVTNQNCAAGEHCVSGRCSTSSRVSCRTDDTCGSGFYCSPTSRSCEPLVSAGCRLDVDCPSHQRCNGLTGACTEGRRTCGQEADCSGAGQHCDLGVQMCVDCMSSADCPAPKVCSNRSCVDPNSSACTEDSACGAPALICEGLGCVPGCHVAGSPVVCALGEACDPNTGRCGSSQRACSTDAQCVPPSTVCDSGQCVPSCTQLGGASCGPNQICDGARGRCVAATPGGCGLDVDCGAPDRICEGGQCQPGCGRPGGTACPGGMTCDAGTGRCRAAAAPACTSDANCQAPTTICDRATSACIPGCSTTGCAANQVCSMTTGRCGARPPPSAAPLNATCNANTDCQSGVCFDFAGNIGRKCVAACGSSADCPAAFTCYDYQGAKMCISAQLLPGATFSTANGGTCTQGIQCRSDYCPSNTCVETCTEGVDCAGSRACRWTEYAADAYIAACEGPIGPGASGARCASDRDCRSGVCYGTGVCGDLCGSTADCPSSSVCGLVNYSVCTLEVGGCYEWQPNFVRTCVEVAHGSGAIGSPCTAAEQCRSNLCHIPSGRCTDSCSRDSDCPSGQVCGVETYGELPVAGGRPTPIFLNVCKPRG